MAERTLSPKEVAKQRLMEALKADRIAAMAAGERQVVGEALAS